jgi:hypothetical protein
MRGLMIRQDITAPEIIEFQFVQDRLAAVAMRRTCPKQTSKRYVKLLTDYCNGRKKTPAELLEEDQTY